MPRSAIAGVWCRGWLRGICWWRVSSAWLFSGNVEESFFFFGCESVVAVFLYFVEYAVEFFFVLFFLLAVGCFLVVSSAVSDVDVWFFLFEHGGESVAEVVPCVVV